MPQPGQGNPVSILKGHKDCSPSIVCPENLKTKKGIASMIMILTIPKILFALKLLIV